MPTLKMPLIVTADCAIATAGAARMPATASARSFFCIKCLSLLLLIVKFLECVAHGQRDEARIFTVCHRIVHSTCGYVVKVVRGRVPVIDLGVGQAYRSTLRQVVHVS